MKRVISFWRSFLSKSRIVTPCSSVDLPGELVDHRVEALVRVHLLAEVEPPHQEVHRLRHPAALDQLGVVGRVPGLEDQRGDVVALDQQAALVVGREVHRADHPLAASLAQPAGRCVEQRVRGLGVVLALEEAEHAVLAALEVVPALVGLGRDPPDDLAVAPGHEVLGLGVVEERVLGAVEEAPAFADERRHPDGPLVEAERQLDELGHLAPPLHGPDLDGVRDTSGT